MSLRKNKAAYGIWSVTMVSHAKTIDEAIGYLKENINDSRHKKHTKDIYIKKQKHHKSIPTRTDKGDWDSIFHGFNAKNKDLLNEKQESKLLKASIFS